MMPEEFLGFTTDQQWDYENGFYLTSHPTRLAKMIAHHELYRSINNLPGHVIVCWFSGNWKISKLAK
jgi:hypothetical protein